MQNTFIYLSALITFTWRWKCVKIINEKNNAQKLHLVQFQKLCLSFLLHMLLSGLVVKNKIKHDFSFCYGSNAVFGCFFCMHGSILSVHLKNSSQSQDNNYGLMPALLSHSTKYLSHPNSQQICSSFYKHLHKITQCMFKLTCIHMDS